jgi:FlaG/FlaF family flagellin (archaellin)
LREIREQQTMPSVESSNRPEKAVTPSPAPRLGVKLMIAIVVGLALVAIYANVQKARRDKIEQVIVTPASTATPTAASPAP